MKISIITVVYNGVNTISNTIDSVLRQSYGNIEYIVVDGASTDGTTQLVESYGNRISKFISEKDTGIYNAMNKGLSLATGDYVGFLNADDFYAHDDVIYTIAQAAKEGLPESLYGDLVFVDQEDPNEIVRYWKAGEYDRYKMLFGWSVPHPTFFVKRSVFQNLGGFNESLRLSADYEMMVRYFFKERITSTYIPEILVRMRLGGAGNAGLKAKLEANKEDAKAWKMNGLKTPFVTMVCKPLRKVPQFIFREKARKSIPAIDLPTSNISLPVANS